MEKNFGFPLTLCLSVATSKLEELYLQGPATYRIYMSREHLQEVEKIFDKIIFDHGLKSVDFEYVIGEPGVLDVELGQNIFIAALDDSFNSR